MSDTTLRALVSVSASFFFFETNDVSVYSLDSNKTIESDMRLDGDGLWERVSS